jgi:two-component system, NtrC family, response regulator
MTKRRLLIIEDESSVAKQLKWSLNEEYDITIVCDAEKSKKLLASGAFPVATLDLGLPPSPDTPDVGLKLLGDLATIAPHTKVIVITGNSEVDNGIKAISSGAVDFCVKPIELKVLKVILDRTFRLQALEEAQRLLKKQADQCGSLCGMIGVAPVMQNLFSLVKKISANDYPVLITGESGTGKEMVAHAIHELSQRRNNPLVIINCGAIPENLLESELFGHERGAFTGAVAKKVGKFEQVNKGTIFLDEISELPLAMQVKILRCLQEGTIERVGGNDVLSLDIRIIAATNTDLKKVVDEGSFREDLYFRLNVVPIELPSLKERPEDIMVLAQHFLRKEAKSLKIGRVSYSSGAIAALSSYNWPGNVRELQNRIRRALTVLNGHLITPEDLGLKTSQADRANEKILTLQAARDLGELESVQRALLVTGNNITQAAKLLDISRPTLHDLIKKHAIKV